MKKIGLIAILLLALTMIEISVKAEDYSNYQEIVFDNDDAYLLKNYSSSNYKSAYKKISRRKFMGWKVYVVHKNEPLEFVSETKLKIYNNGYTPIKHNIKLETKEETKHQLQASGSIKISIDGKLKEFKGGVDQEIKSSISYSKTTTSIENYEFQIVIDPKTYVKIITRGTGEISNGVAQSYVFWIKTIKGGWEIFTVQTEYYEIIKERIR
ncbi:MAG: hypothetical protein WCY80_01665 [Candidatus Izemoplasmatales bacterium]